MSEPCELSLSEAEAAIAAGRLTPADLLESTLVRIERV
jgi:Asp-tRNA(Asn)/Glu-tRNA(Gln) amidotransferase A subunit family amidase